MSTQREQRAGGHAGICPDLRDLTQFVAEALAVSGANIVVVLLSL